MEYDDRDVVDWYRLKVTNTLSRIRTILEGNKSPSVRIGGVLRLYIQDDNNGLACLTTALGRLSKEMILPYELRDTFRKIYESPTSSTIDGGIERNFIQQDWIDIDRSLGTALLDFRNLPRLDNLDLSDKFIDDDATLSGLVTNALELIEKIGLNSFYEMVAYMVPFRKKIHRSKSCE